METLSARCYLYQIKCSLYQPPSHDVDKDLPLMISLLKPKFSFQPLYTDRKNVMTKIKEFVSNVCDFAFSVTVPTTILFLKPQSAFIQPQFHEQA